MSINIHAKTDYSFLFSSLGSGAAGVGGSNFLADYASIKNGSYGKLMRAYYSETASDSVKSVVEKKAEETKKSSTTKKDLTKEASREYANMQKTSDALKESADALLDRSLFRQKDIITENEDGTQTSTYGYDVNAIYKAVNSFVTDYNSVVNATKGAEDSTLARRVTNMRNSTTGNEKALAEVGITLNKDGTLSLDKDTFSKADMSKVKTLFNGNGSYGYQVSAQASLINYAADNVVRRGSTYTTDGSYNMNFNNGNLFSTYF